MYGSVKPKQLIGSGTKLNYELTKGKSSGEWSGKHFPRKSLNYHFANLLKVEKKNFPFTKYHSPLWHSPVPPNNPPFPAVPEAGPRSLRLGPKIKSTSRRPKIKLTSRIKINFKELFLGPPDSRIICEKKSPGKVTEHSELQRKDS